MTVIVIMKIAIMIMILFEGIWEGGFSKQAQTRSRTLEPKWPEPV